MKRLVLVLGFAVAAWGQNPPASGLQPVSSPTPGGSCTNSQPAFYSSSDQKLYTCLAGIWTASGGGSPSGAAGGPSITAGSTFPSTIDGGYFNVKSVAYGAKGDGTTDDRAAVQSAINAAASAGGGTVCFPSGTYLMNSYITDTAGDEFNLYTSGDNLSLSPCAGSPAGSVKLLQGSVGAGSNPSGGGFGVAKGPLAFFPSSLLTSSVGQNGYQSPTQNGGYYALSAISAGARAITFTTPSQAGNVAVGDWIITSIVNTAPSNPNPVELNRVTSVNTGSGVVGLMWAQTQAYSTAYAAKVTSIVRQNITVDGLILQGAFPLFANNLYNFKFTNTQFIADGTYAAAASQQIIYANALKQGLVENCTFTVFPFTTAYATFTELPQNNSSDLTWNGNTFNGYSFGNAEYIERETLTGNTFNVWGAASQALLFSGYDIKFLNNTVNSSATSGTVYADYSTATNTYSWNFASIKARGNHFNSYSTTGTNNVVAIYAPDTEVSGNFILGGPAQLGISLQVSGVAAANSSNSTLVPTNVIVGNTLLCNDTTSLGCLLGGSPNLTFDGGVIANNTLIGTNGSTYGLWIQDLGSAVSGTLTIAANNYSGFATAGAVIQNPARHANIFVSDPVLGILSPSAVTFPGVTSTNGVTVTGAASSFTASGNVATFTDSTNSGGFGLTGSFINSGTNNDTCVSIRNINTGGRNWYMCSGASGSGTSGQSFYLYDATGSARTFYCQSGASCGFSTLSVSTALTIGAVPRFNGTNTTGSTAYVPAGTNCPAVTCTAPYTWVQATSSDGSTVYIPVFK